VTPTDDDRIAYLAGDAGDSLSADDRSELDRLRDVLGSPSTWVEPDAALEDRIVDAIVGEAGTGHASVGAAGAQSEAGAGEQPAAAAEPMHKPARRLRWRVRRPNLAFGAAAVGLAAVIAAVIVIASGSSSSAPAGQRFAMVISGTPLAPGAHGSATLEKTASGWHIHLTATGLPRLSGQQFFYQAWLKNAAGILVPVGTFNDARDVTLWSGVPVTQYRVLTVTIQPANGNPTSSGRRVLIGTIRSTG
jgi:hypothetical protein